MSAGVRIESRRTAGSGRHDITRRRLLALSGALLAAPLAAAAQQKVYRIGLLLSTVPEDPGLPRALEAFRQGLREHRYVEGQNVTFEYRYARGKNDLFPELAADLVRIGVDVILVGPGPAALTRDPSFRAFPLRSRRRASILSRPPAT